MQNISKHISTLLSDSYYLLNEPKNKREIYTNTNHVPNFIITPFENKILLYLLASNREPLLIIHLDVNERLLFSLEQSNFLNFLKIFV